MFQEIVVDINGRVVGGGCVISWPDPNVDLHYNRNQLLINAVREANNTVGAQEESRKQLKAFNNLLGFLKLVF